MERIKRALTEARRERQKLQEGPLALLEDSAARNTTRSDAKRQAPSHYLIWFWGAVATIMTAFTLYILWWPKALDPVESISMSALEVQARKDASIPGKLQVRDTADAAFKQDIESLNVQVNTLTNAIERIEGKIQRMHVRLNTITNTIVARASDTGAADTGTATSKGEQQIAAISTKQLDAVDNTDGISAKQKPEIVKQRGLWVINLASFPTKTAADRFALSAEGKGVPVEQKQVTVKGKEYWRVQATDFPTAKEARSYADTITDKLGLKGVWVSKR